MFSLYTRDLCRFDTIKHYANDLRLLNTMLIRIKTPYGIRTYACMYVNGIFTVNTVMSQIVM